MQGNTPAQIYEETAGGRGFLAMPRSSSPIIGEGQRNPALVGFCRAIAEELKKTDQKADDWKRILQPDRPARQTPSSKLLQRPPITSMVHRLNDHRRDVKTSTGLIPGIQLPQGGRPMEDRKRRNIRLKENYKSACMAEQSRKVGPKSPGVSVGTVFHT